jgi:hypothetical protein
VRRVFAVLTLLCALSLPARADLIKQSSTWNRVILMQDSTTSRSPGVAGLTLTITASKNGAAFASITPTVTDLGNGLYSLALTTTHTNTLGAFDMRITGTGADETDTHDQIVAFDPADAAALGLSRLDAAISSRSTYAGADTSGTTTLLARLTSTRAGNLDSLDAAISSRMASFTLPTNFSALAITAGGAVTAGTVSDKTGYSLTQAFPANFSSLSITAGGLVSLNLAQALGSSPWDQTPIGDAFKAAWSQGWGKWVIAGGNLTLYAPDNTTPARSPFAVTPTPANASRQ